jgi:hypothetical protein
MILVAAEVCDHEAHQFVNMQGTWSTSAPVHAVKAHVLEVN